MPCLQRFVHRPETRSVELGIIINFQGHERVHVQLYRKAITAEVRTGKVKLSPQF